ncbi:unnamed protein product [Calypogeia fissa]
MDLSFNTFIVVARHVSLDLADHRTISVKQKIERVQSPLKPMNVMTRSVCLGQNPVLSGGVAKPTSKGPSWTVSLGRRDAFSANTNLTTNIAPPSFNVTQLQDNFAAQNLTTRDLVALLGAHTIGFSHCGSINSRLYNFSGINGTADPTISRTLLTALEATCPSRVNHTVITSLDIQTPTLFDNRYFQNLLQGNGVLNSDEELVTAADDTNSWVNLYAADQSQFFNDFAAAIIKMGNLNVLTGTAGEIRQNCRARNPVSTISVEETSVTPIRRKLSMARTMFMKMEARSSSKLWRTSNSNLYGSAMLRTRWYPQ